MLLLFCLSNERLATAFQQAFKMQELDFPDKETKDMDMALRYVNVAHIQVNGRLTV